MLILISPAKTLDYRAPAAPGRYTEPGFLDDSAILIERLRQLAPPQVAELMGISPALADLNFGRYLNWSRPFTRANARPALLAFRGDVYAGLNADSFTAADRRWAQRHLRILSGLYGLLRPLDLMQPYRLEMGTRLTTDRGKDLYEFWGERITAAINAELANDRKPVVINLASVEYYKAVRPALLHAEVITPVFQDWSGGQYKVISFYAKRARGMMSAYIIKHRLRSPRGLQEFTGGGYAFDAARSTARDWVFVRNLGDCNPTDNSTDNNDAGDSDGD